MSNTRLWDKLGRTDPSNTKSFKRAGGFSGTAIKPMWSFKRMTEEFGPCGLGWGVNEPSFQVVNGCEGEVLVYCTVSIWYVEAVPSALPESMSLGTTTKSSSVFGVGGDKVVVKQQSGLRSDDEAFKKAYTDAIGNALKLIGVGADVHMGLFDDSKYVNSMRQEFAEDAAPKPPTEPAQPTKGYAQHLSDITSSDGLEGLQTAFAAAWRSALPKADKEQLKEAYEARKSELSGSYVPPSFDKLEP